MSFADYSMQRFLASKRSVDDRSLNRVVLESLHSELSAHDDSRPPLRVLELGAGLGNMVTRLCDWNILRRARYTLLDRDAQSLREGVDALAAAGAQAGRVRRSGDALLLDSPTRELEILWKHAELFQYLGEQAAPASYDLVIAHAVLDLVHVPALLPRLWRALAPNGLVWFTINFDGDSVFLPTLPMDDAIFTLYHRSMDRADAAGGRQGDSRTGRHLLEHLPAAGGTVLSAGSSDWVVFPNRGSYPGDEAQFLHHIVHTIDSELKAHPALDPTAFQRWVTARHGQVDKGELIYIAHQLDLLARAPASTSASKSVPDLRPMY